MRLLLQLLLKKEDKYVPILDALEAGEIIQIETSNDKEAKGYRISLGRKSRSRGFSTEYRTDGNTLYVKKSDALITPSKSKAKKEKATASA